MSYIPYNSNIITRYNSSTLINIIKQLPLEYSANFNKLDRTDSNQIGTTDFNQIHKVELKQLRLLYNSTRDGYDFDVYYDKVHSFNNLVILVKCNVDDLNNPCVFGMFSSIKYSFQQPKLINSTDSIGFNDRNSILFSISDYSIMKPRSQRGVDILNGYPTCFNLFNTNKAYVDVNELNRMFNVNSSNPNSCFSLVSCSNNFDITNIEVYKLYPQSVY